MSDEVSKLLRADLVRLGLTQEEFANKLGVTQQAVSAWCARDAIPYRRLKAIENALGSDSQLVAYMRDLPREVVLYDRPVRVREMRPPRVATEVSQQGTSLARPNIIAHMQGEYRRFREMIESELPAGRIDVPVQIGQITRLYDYVSDSLCIELMTLTPMEGRTLLNSPRVYAKLVTLMLMRQVTSKDFPDRHFSIIVVAQDPEFEATPHLSRLRWECEQFDVSLNVVPTVEAAAALVIRIENSLGDVDELAV